MGSAHFDPDKNVFMASRELDELAAKLVLLQLVSQSQIDDCLFQLGRKDRTVSSLLDLLERRGFLTSFQVSRIAKDDMQGLILGPFKLMYRNASGSFARVYRGCDLRDGKMVGIKVLRQRWASDPQNVVQFHREAELGKSLKHENIVPIYEVGQSGDQHYFSMEFVEGGNLRDFINIRRKLSAQEATKCILEMTQGLHYAAGRGALHRDLKMTNVLMSSQGVAKLVDFGLSGGRIDTDVGDSESVQRALDYATLEKGTGVPRNDPRSDLYFLGAIYYELLTGIPPLERTRNRAERGRFSRYQEVAPVRTVDPELPRSVCAIVDRLMQVNPTLRYQSTGEAIRDLTMALVELGDTSFAGAASEKRAPADAGRNLRTIMCIEDRHKQQDLLREYFSKHGFRVLVLGDLQRGLNRLETNPPDCVLFMGESIGEPAVKGFAKAQQIHSPSPLMSILVLGEKQAEWRDQVHESELSQVVVQPITLRDLRKRIVRALRNQNPAEDLANANGDDGD